MTYLAAAIFTYLAAVLSLISAGLRSSLLGAAIGCVLLISGCVNLGLYLKGKHSDKNKRGQLLPLLLCLTAMTFLLILGGCGREEFSAAAGYEVSKTVNSPGVHKEIDSPDSQEIEEERGDSLKTEEPSPVAENTDEPSAADAATENTYPLVVNVGSPVMIDLDGDGTVEAVCFDISNSGEFQIFIGEVAYDGESLQDHGFYSSNLEQKYYCITDIETSDGLLEIAIMDYGPSDDYISSFFRYASDGLRFIGRVSGLVVRSLRDTTDVTFSGDGSVHSYMRLSVLQTWFALVDWRIAESGGFEVVPQTLYYSR